MKYLILLLCGLLVGCSSHLPKQKQSVPPLKFVHTNGYHLINTNPTTILLSPKQEEQARTEVRNNISTRIVGLPSPKAVENTKINQPMKKPETNAHSDSLKELVFSLRDSVATNKQEIQLNRKIAKISGYYSFVGLTIIIIILFITNKNLFNFFKHNHEEENKK